MILIFALVFLTFGTAWLLIALFVRSNVKGHGSWFTDAIGITLTLLTNPWNIGIKLRTVEQQKTIRASEEQKLLDPLSSHQILSIEGKARSRLREISAGFHNLKSYYSIALTVILGVILVFAPRSYYFGVDTYLLNKYQADIAITDSPALSNSLNRLSDRKAEFRSPVDFAASHYTKDEQRKLSKERSENKFFSSKKRGFEGISESFKHATETNFNRVLIAGLMIVFAAMAFFLSSGSKK